MSLQSDDTFTVVVANNVNLSTFKTNSYSKPELDLISLEAETVDVGANMLAQVGAVTQITADTVDISSNSIDITGTLVVQTDTSTSFVFIPDPVDPLPHVLLFKNGLLTEYKRGYFDIVIKTDNPGTTGFSSFILPLVATGFYDMLVLWGDGQSSVIKTHNDPAKLHNYAVPGVYNIKIVGPCQGWCFGNTYPRDPQKLLRVNSWGPDFRLGKKESYYFDGCSNMNIFATDTLDLTGTTSLFNAFSGCNSLTAPAMNTWDVSQVENMVGVFKNCGSFNTNIGAWDLSNVKYMSDMFFQCNLFNNGGSPSIQNWHAPKCTSFLNMFYRAYQFNQPLDNLVDTALTSNVFCDYMFYEASFFNGTLTNWNTSNVVSTNSMFQFALSFNQNIGSWNTSKFSNCYAMFRQTTKFNNGQVTTLSTVNPGNVNYTPIGSLLTCTGAQFLNPAVVVVGDTLQILTGTDWYIVTVTNINSNTQLVVSPVLSVFLTGVVNLQKPTSGTNPLAWDFSQVTQTSQMFFLCPNFNQYIGIPAPVSEANFSQCEYANEMFRLATSFNNGAPVGASTAPMRWKLGKLLSANYMFSDAYAFNSPMVAIAPYWNLSLLQSANYMFSLCKRFNQNIGSWNMSSAVYMEDMFYFASVFNNGNSSDIGNWNVGSAFNMRGMFNGALAFKQSIASWKPYSCQVFNLMFNSVDMNNPDSTVNRDNYNALLNAWGNDPLMPSFITFSAGVSKYTAGVAGAARNNLVVNKGWSITDGGSS